MLAGLSLAGKFPAHGEALVLPPLHELLKRSSPSPGFRVVTGHQPGFWHAGIAFKVWLACRLAKEWGCGPAAFYGVDHEPAQEIKLMMPGMGDRPRSEHVLLQDERVAGRIPDGDLKSWPERLGDEERDLADLWKSHCDGKDFAGAMTGMLLDLLERRTGLKPRCQNVLRLAKEPAFFAFAHRILKDLPNYVSQFNRALAKVRDLHKVRHPALPLPDLLEDECPFWQLDGRGFRHPLRRVSAGLRFESATGGGAWDLPSDPGELESLSILPKAATLTQFLRLEKADLFLHGLGGAGYEEVNDIFWPGYDGRALAPYAVASFSWIPGGDAETALIQARQALRRGLNNPEDLVPAGSEGEALAREKRALRASSGGGAELHRKIQDLNKRLAALLDGPIKRLEADVEAAQNRLGAGRRDDPFIFMKASDFRKWEDIFDQAKGRAGSA